MSVKVKTEYVAANLIVNGHANQPLAILRAMAANQKRWPEQKTKLKVNGSMLNNVSQQPLGESNIRDGTFVTVSLQQYNYPYNSAQNTNLPLTTLDMNEEVDVSEAERMLPGVLLVDKPAYVKLLFFLANQHNTEIHQRVMRYGRIPLHQDLAQDPTGRGQV